MVTNVISRLVDVIAKHSTIAKIHKYKRLYEGHHFIPIAMEVHGTPKHGMNRFIMPIFSTRQLRGHLSSSFCIQFFKQCVSIAF